MASKNLWTCLLLAQVLLSLAQIGSGRIAPQPEVSGLLKLLDVVAKVKTTLTRLSQMSKVTSKAFRHQCDVAHVSLWLLGREQDSIDGISSEG